VNFCGHDIKLSHSVEKEQVGSSGNACDRVWKCPGQFLVEAPTILIILVSPRNLSSPEASYEFS
jgi:hypothetical protein